MKGSNTFRWAIAIGVVVAAAAFWFWHSRSESPTAAPGVAAQAPHTASAGRRGMRD
ncbi:multidrug transporter subunit MdtA, partial [Salmonella enterica subsp. enterica serovar Typhimurium]|nr:multidrug transporter subunit MdtA [Salmonella enterica subsp. enterica serovar Anatum]